MILALLLACFGDNIDPCDGEECEDTAAAVCLTSIVPTNLIDGATGVSVANILGLELLDPDRDEELKLFDANGVEVEGQSKHSGDRLLFKPDTILQYDAKYTLALTYCKSSEETTEEFTFDTAPAINTNTLPEVGHHYIVDPKLGSSGGWSSILDLLMERFENNQLWSISSLAENSLTLETTVTEPLASEQDFCLATSTLEGSVNDGTFLFSNIDIPLNGNRDFVLHNAHLYGQFSANGNTIEDIQMQGKLDIREAFDFFLLNAPNLLSEIETPSELCSLLGDFGEECQPCQRDQQPFCVDIYWENLRGSQYGQDVAEVCEDDCHTLCPHTSCEQPQETTEECTTSE